MTGSSCRRYSVCISVSEPLSAARRWSTTSLEPLTSLLFLTALEWIKSIPGFSN